MSITRIKNRVSGRVAASAVGVTMALALIGAAGPAQAAALTSAQISSIVSLLQNFGADATTVANVQATLNGQPTTSSTSSSTSCTVTFTRTLRVGSTGADVKALQQWLNANGYTVQKTGAGSMGHETNYFGQGVKKAVMAFQKANGITPASGLVGSLTRTKLNAMCTSTTGTTGTTGTTTTTTTTTTVGSLVVAAATQPANAVVPSNSTAQAHNVPFTNFTLTNTSSSAVTVSSVTVQRVGVAADADFATVVLLDSTGAQVGLTHTFNSNHQTNIGDGFTLAAGASMTYTVAGNMSTSPNSGDAPQLQVVAINTTAAISGSLPISGAIDTINTALNIGTVSTSTSSYDPGAATNKNLGSTGVTVSGVRFTAGSAEDLKLTSIRWRQVGTAGQQDISNVTTTVVGAGTSTTKYPVTIDSTGKYYTAVFPSGGILLSKGNSMDVYIQADLSGNAAASRTLEFDIDKVTDINFVGQLYGFGITPSGSYNPWYQGFVTTIKGGSATSIQNAVSVASQNIALNVPNTVLGGIQTNFVSEPVQVTKQVYRLSYGSATASSNLITSVSLVDGNGKIVAGPVDAVNVGGGQMKVTFTDTVTFPVGAMTYTLKGKIPTGPSNGDTLAASTTPSADWSGATGQTTGNSISLPSSAVTTNTMTIQTGQLAITASPNPVAANIVAGVQNWNLGNIQLDASQSGEDIRLATLPVSIIVDTTANGGNLNTCQLVAPSGATVNSVVTTAATPLNTGTNIVNPTSSTVATTNVAGAKNTFTFDNPLTIPKGTVVTLAVNCNIVSGASLVTVQIGVLSSNTYTSTGVQSGATITPTATTGTGGVQTIKSGGTLTSTAASTAVAQPALVLAAADSTGITQGYVKFHASNEDINLQKIGLTLANGTYGSKSTGAGGTTNNGVNDVSGQHANNNPVVVYLYSGSTSVGTATFTGTGQTATSTLTTPLKIPKDTDLTLTIKADLAPIGFSSQGGIGDTVKIDPLNAQAVGLAAGDTINIAATAGVNGVQMFKSVPVVALATGACSGTGCSGANQVLKAFTITANASGPVSVENLNFLVSTSSANATNLIVSVYDNTGNVSTTTFGAKQCGSGCTTNQSAGTAIITFTGGPVLIPAGTSYTFKLLGTVTPGATATNWSVISTLQGDASSTGIGTTPAQIGTTTANLALAPAGAPNFVWSDNATTTASLTDVDWFGGNQVSGLPSIGI